MNIQEKFLVAIEAAIEGGKKTLEFYKSNLDVALKDDNSPLTQADLQANNIIERYLETTGIPILSEERKPETFEQRKKWEELWIVDPLDGTKEFIKKSDEYTVNIALVKGNTPVMGVVYAPAMDLLYFGAESLGAYKVSNASKKPAEEILHDSTRERLPIENNSAETVVVASKSHRNPETEEYLTKLSERIKNVRIESFGSSLKLCMIAEGRAQIYPRIGPTMEWDTAASHAIVTASGALIAVFPSFEDMQYNKENLLNPWFIVYSKEKEKAVRIQ